MFNLFKCRHKRTYFKQSYYNDRGYVLYKCSKCEVILKTTQVYGIEEGKCYSWKCHQDGKVEVTSHDHKEETFIGEDIAKLRHQGMLLEKVPEKYITVTLGTYDARINRAEMR